MEVTKLGMSKAPRIVIWYYFCNILRKIDEVYFLHAIEHESFLQIVTNILGMFGQT